MPEHYITHLNSGQTNGGDTIVDERFSNFKNVPKAGSFRRSESRYNVLKSGKNFTAGLWFNLKEVN